MPHRIAAITLLLVMGFVATDVSVSPVRATDPTPTPTPTPTSGPPPAGGEGILTTPTDQVPVPYGSPGWRYQQVAHNGIPGFEAPGFNDAGWPLGTAAFGAGNCPIQSQVHTPWSLNTDMLLRRSVTVAATAPGMAVWVGIDNSVKVYWDGQLISGNPTNHEGCTQFDTFIFPVPEPLDDPGTHTLAVRAIDTGGDSFIDVAVRVASDGEPPGERFRGQRKGHHQNDPTGTQGDPVNSLTGAYTYTADDLTVPGRGLGVSFTRNYNSTNTADGPLGPGWSHPYQAKLTFNPDGSIIFDSEDSSAIPFLPDGNGGFYPAYGVLSMLAPVQPSGYVLTTRDLIRYEFNAAGQLTAQKDRNNNAITFAYTGANLTTITDTVGRAYTLSYTANRLTELRDMINRTVTYTYHPDGRLATVADLRGGLWSYGYDTGGRLNSIVDPNLHTVAANVYGPDGRVIEQRDGKNELTTWAWDPVAQTSTMHDARGGDWVDTYDGFLLVSKRDPLGNTTQYTYDAMYSPATVTDPRGNITTLRYEANGNLWQRVAPPPLNYTETFSYNPDRTLGAATDGRGNVTYRTYDTSGNLVRVDEPLSVTTNYGRDPAGTGLLLSLTDPRGKVTVYGYDADANLNRVTTPLGFITTYTYDDLGRRLTMVEARGNVTGANPLEYTWQYGYNPGDLLTSITDPLAHITSYGYDAAGNRTSMTDANQHPIGWVYDEDNRLLTVTDADAKVTTYGYDAVGNLTSRLDANQHVTSYAYDLARRLTQTTAPLNRIWTYGYDAANNRTSVTDANGNATPGPGDGVTASTFDALNRLATVNYSDTTPDVTYGYDPNSNLTAMIDGSGTETRVFDALNRITSVDRGGQVLSWGYDPASNLLSRTYVGVITTYTYDNDNRVTSEVTAGKTATFTYDAAANLTQRQLPSQNSYVETRTYDRAGRVTRVRNAKAGSTLADYTYVLDPVGNVSEFTTLSQRRAYTYDLVDRLLTETCTLLAGGACPVPFVNHTYDPVGNRLTEQRSAGTTNYGYDAADRLLTAGATTYTWDADGNELSAGSRTFTYDLANRMRTTTLGSTTTTYSYAGDGRRLEASTGAAASAKTRFAWDISGGLPLLAYERDGANVLLRRYIYAPGGTLAVTTPTTIAYYHFDRLGSVVNLTSDKAKTYWTYDYEPYGAVRSQVPANSPPANPLNFTGQYLDPTGLYHLRARQYEGGVGRFVTTDPASIGIENPHLSPYVYANGNPARFTDPTGLFSLGLCAQGQSGIVRPAIPAVFGFLDICLQVTSTGQLGVTLQVGGGVTTSTLASGGVGVVATNGDYFEDIDEGFQHLGGAGTVFGRALSGDVAAGSGRCGQTVTQTQGNIGFGSPIGGEFHYARSRTLQLTLFDVNWLPGIDPPGCDK